MAQENIQSTHDMVQNGDLTIVRTLLENDKVDLEKVDEQKRTLLHIAAMHGHLDLVNFLMTGSDVNAANEDGNTPLHLAYKGGYKDIAKTLVENGANIHKENNKRETPFDYAFQYINDSIKETRPQQEKITSSLKSPSVEKNAISSTSPQPHQETKPSSEKKQKEKVLLTQPSSTTTEVENPNGKTAPWSGSTTWKNYGKDPEIREILSGINNPSRSTTPEPNQISNPALDYLLKDISKVTLSNIGTSTRTSETEEETDEGKFIPSSKRKK